jgi:hypothetical protein
LRERTTPRFVLLHGFLSFSFSYRRLIPVFADDFSVIAADSTLVIFPHTDHLLSEKRPHDAYREITRFIR